eukprot:240938_1
MTTVVNSNRVKFGRYYVEVYVQHYERIYNLLIGWAVEQVTYSYYDETESFSQINCSKRCDLNNTNLICTLTTKGASTAYGNVTITKRLDIKSYKWSFKIQSKKLNMFIGVDSNAKFSNTDFSNYYRSFSTTHDDIFCAYGSDGNIYDHKSVIAETYGIAWKTGDTIDMIIDAQKETLRYIVNGNDQGIALKNMRFCDKSYKIAIALFYPDDRVRITDFDIEWKENIQENDFELSDDETSQCLDINSLPTLEGYLLIKEYSSWIRKFVIIKGPYMCVNDEDKKEFDMKCALIIIQVLAVTFLKSQRKLLIQTIAQSGGSDKQWMFRTPSETIRDHWVSVIQGYINTYH